MKKNEHIDNSIFADTMTGLAQAIEIEKGDIPMKEVKDMPAKTYRFIPKEAKSKRMVK